MDFLANNSLVETAAGPFQGFGSSDTYQPISVAWLSSKNNWPEHLAQKLQELMNTHDLKNYKSTNYESRRKLERITNELQLMFDQQEWKDGIHWKKLEDKIRNKIHRIRAKEAKERDALVKLEFLLNDMPKKTHGAAMRVVLATLGREAVAAGLDEHDFLNFEDDDEA